MKARELLLLGFSVWGSAHIMYNVAEINTFIISFLGWKFSPLTILGIGLIFASVVLYAKKKA